MLLQAVKTLHDENLSHGNISLRNCLVTNELTLFLADSFNIRPHNVNFKQDGNSKKSIPDYILDFKPYHRTYTIRPPTGITIAPERLRSKSSIYTYSEPENSHPIVALDNPMFMSLSSTQVPVKEMLYPVPQNATDGRPSDMFSVGCTLFELYSDGIPLFTNSTAFYLHDPSSDLSGFVQRMVENHLPSAIQPLVISLLQLLPKDRWNANDALTALLSISNKTGTEQPIFLCIQDTIRPALTLNFTEHAEEMLKLWRSGTVFQYLNPPVNFSQSFSQFLSSHQWKADSSLQNIHQHPLRLLDSLKALLEERTTITHKILASSSQGNSSQPTQSTLPTFDLCTCQYCWKLNHQFDQTLLHSHDKPLTRTFAESSLSSFTCTDSSVRRVMRSVLQFEVPKEATASNIFFSETNQQFQIVPRLISLLPLSSVADVTLLVNLSSSLPLEASPQFLKLILTLLERSVTIQSQIDVTASCVEAICFILNRCASEGEFLVSELKTLTSSSSKLFADRSLFKQFTSLVYDLFETATSSLKKLITEQLQPQSMIHTVVSLHIPHMIASLYRFARVVHISSSNEQMHLYTASQNWDGILTPISAKRAQMLIFTATRPLPTTFIEIVSKLATIGEQRPIFHRSFGEYLMLFLLSDSFELCQQFNKVPVTSSLFSLSIPFFLFRSVSLVPSPVWSSLSQHVESLPPHFLAFSANVVRSLLPTSVHTDETVAQQNELLTQALTMSKTLLDIDSAAVVNESVKLIAALSTLKSPVDRLNNLLPLFCSFFLPELTAIDLTNPLSITHALDVSRHDKIDQFIAVSSMPMRLSATFSTSVSSPGPVAISPFQKNTETKSVSPPPVIPGPAPKQFWPQHQSVSKCNLISSINAHKGAIVGIECHPFGDVAVSVDTDETVRVWEVREAASDSASANTPPKQNVLLERKQIFNIPSKQSTMKVNSITVLDENKLVLNGVGTMTAKKGSEEQLLCFVDLKEGRLQQTIQLSPKEPHASPSVPLHRVTAQVSQKPLLAFTHDLRTVHIMDTLSQTVIWTAAVPGDIFSSITSEPNSNNIAVSTLNGDVLLYDLRMTNPLWSTGGLLDTGRSGLKSVVVSPFHSTPLSQTSSAVSETLFLATSYSGKISGIGVEDGTITPVQHFCLPPPTDNARFLSVIPIGRNTFARSFGNEFSVCTLRQQMVIEKRVLTNDTFILPFQPYTRHMLPPVLPDDQKEWIPPRIEEARNCDSSEPFPTQVQYSKSSVPPSLTITTGHDRIWRNDSFTTMCRMKNSLLVGGNLGYIHVFDCWN
ncbi:hypothetical protein BLNAU_69 [Blattamonas nauphoetae]|uniref:Protein kinase domain-containing protein n=1 Tax=Blattamonas nauphoetae TaxID=2049346 RepID=A0ABQ9YLY2_9EUKA|nr:hypothetical protein BLNAU_69 [Blattamonas nauphoetae]